ncbi:MAG: hypothetical protein NT070_07435 [Cyanobacteria bacterium]|nr:hypothetical protein [Cyanobacteriota bacterium]
MSKYTQSFQFLLATSSVCISGIILTAVPAQAFQFNFGHITSNKATNVAAGESQLFMDVTDATGKDNLSSSSVLFKFSNVGSVGSSITQIYFDNSSILKSIGPIADSGIGVDYSIASGNLNLPGGNSLTNKFVSDFGIEANTPVSQEGVNPGEWVNVLFNLTPTKTLQDVINDMTNGSMRVGIHVQAFGINGKDGSEAFVNRPTVKPPVVVSTPPVVAPIPPVVVSTPPVVVPAPPVVVPAPPVVVPAPPVVVPTPPVVVSTPPVVVPTPPVVLSTLVPSIEIKPPVPKHVPEPAFLWAMGAIVGKFALRRRAKTITISS